jgi:class 3 adenylate cyclase/tetratricopeptide (TPR) repeat protein
MSEQLAGRLSVVESEGVNATAANSSAPGLPLIAASLSAYLPWDRRRAVATGHELSDRASGAALYIDISGFTKFTDEAVERWGPRRAAEEVSQLVNEFCEHAITQVHMYGGSVIGFAGDGITSWFDGDRGRRAAAAALAIDHPSSEQLTAAESIAGRGMPPVTIVLTAGLARRFVVGHPDIQSIDILAGGILDRLATAEKVARPGEVLAGSEIIGWLGSDATLGDWKRDDVTGESFAVISGDPALLATPEQIPDTQLDDDRARDWVLPPVRQRHATAGGRIENELRPACSLFLSFGGIDYDFDNQAAEKLDAFIGWVQSVFSRFGAYVLQIIVGDKGSYLYGAFGAPLAHEDDSLRALRAGGQLLRPPAQLDYITNLKIGLDVGPVLAGSYGGRNRRTYGILGQSVNNAARLMEAAGDGQMLATHDVLAGAAADITGSELPELPALQGVRVMAIDEVHPRRGIERVAGPSLELVGRERELRMSAAQLDKLRRGESGALYIRGPAGMGTSRLLAGLRDRADDLGISVVVGAGDAIERESPFFAFRTVLADLISITSSSDATAIRTALAKRLLDAPATLLPLLNPLLPVPLPESPLTLNMPPQARRDQTYRLIVDAFTDRTDAFEGRVLIIDDAQWLDPASITLLESLTSRVPGLLVAIGARTDVDDGLEPTDPLIEEIVRKADGDVAELGPLGREDVERIAAAAIDADELPDSVAELIVERSGGSPYFAKELAQSLLAEGLVRVQAGRCELVAAPDELGDALPEQLQSGLVAQLDKLTPEQQLIMRSGAVLGSSFDTDLLGAAIDAELDETSINEALARLLDSGFLQSSGADAASGEYRFESTLVRDAAASLVPTASRRQVHLRAANHLEQIGAATRTEHFPLLAHHWDGAGAPQRAADYWAMAGNSASASSFDGNAIAFYRRALDLVTEFDSDIEDFDRSRWELRLGESYVQLQGSDSALGRRWLEEGLRRLGHPVRSRAWTAALAVLPQLMRQTWWRLRGPRSVPPDDGDLLLEASRAFERLVEVYFLAGDRAQSLEASVRSLNLAESAGPSPELARETATFGTMLGIVPLPRLAERYLGRALATVDSTNDRSAMAWVPMVAAFYYAGRGDWANADGLAKRALSVAQESGDLRRYEDALSNLMMQAYLQGDIATGLERANELTNRADERGAELGRAYGLQGKVYCLLDAGRLEEAATAIEELQQIFGASREPVDEGVVADTSALSALLHARTEQWSDARRLADETLAYARRETPSNFSGFATFAAPVEVQLLEAMHRGLDRDLERAIRLSLRGLRRYARRFPVGRPRLHAYTGTLWWMKNRAKKSERDLLASIEHSERLGMRLEEANARHALSSITASSGAGGPQAAAAEQILAELRLKHFVSVLSK